ncbi:hydroxyacid dehydrogenase [Microbacterium aquimaris]|uniref:Hydroxyacid dehydrogenase n=1 Tax=Microbacterium aquimaris TaxID=459816 RepID=A0ABU5N340_9MICO|nr:hydroxyacid dehydrogenase [Microbacterium aquimaris]MDZ8160347.1 hydroxyacid dehydrogenase [Microbacterium aquimaris]
MTRVDAPRSDRPGADVANPDELGLGRYAVAMSSDDLARRLFGQDLELLRAAPGVAELPVVTAFDDETFARLADVDVLVTGWGAPAITAEVLDRLPRLSTVIHAGGGTDALIAPEIRSRLQRSNAGSINAIPVAEYSLAMIMLACRQVFASQRIYRQVRGRVDREQTFPDAGLFGQTVGLVGASRIGRRVIDLLRPFSVHILLADPYLTEDDAFTLGVELAPLDEVMRRSDVVSLHPPLNDETRGMIGAREIALMRDGATLLNTSRGGVVDLPALQSELLSGRIEAILDVTDPFEPLPADSPLWECENVVLTPHVAGSMGTELRRMGEHVADELTRALRGQPLEADESPAR